MPINPSARFRVTNAPRMAPANCFLCKGVNNPPFIDPGLRIDYYKDAPDPTHDGNVYICSACVKDMANTIGYTADLDKQLSTARREGVIAGLEIGRKHLNEYASLIDSTIDLNHRMLTGYVDFSVADIAKDAEPEQSDSGKTDKIAEQSVFAGIIEGPIDLPNDRNDGLFDLFT